MARSTALLLCAAAFLTLGYLLRPAPPAVAAPAPGPAEGRLPAGPVLVLAKEKGGYTLEKAELRRVAGRAFLVGKEMKDSPYTKPTFGGLVVWVPLDSVTTLVELEPPKAGKAAPGR
jgi:hypothetical protein